MENHALTDGGSEPCLPLLRVVETDCAPLADQAFLVDRLRQSPGFVQTLTDRSEVHPYQGPLAGLNACKHRLQALRAEYARARLRADDLEAQLTESRTVIRSLEVRLAEVRGHADFLQRTLDEVQASRAWQLLDKCSGLRRAASQLVALVWRLARRRAWPCPPRGKAG